MTPWMVELSGDLFEMEELLRLTSTLKLTIVEEKDPKGRSQYYMRSEEFDPNANASEIRDQGIEFVNVINGIGQLQIADWHNVRLIGVAKEESIGARTQYIFPEPVKTRARVSANPTIIKADGTIVRPRRPSRLEGDLSLAHDDTAVHKALRIIGSRVHNWVNLYVIYEIVSADVGGKIVIANRGWATQNQIEIFKRTANSVTAVGDESRHGQERYQPPPNPMALSEAQSFIYQLLRAWISAKKNQS